MSRARLFVRQTALQDYAERRGWDGFADLIWQALQTDELLRGTSFGL